MSDVEDIINGLLRIQEWVMDSKAMDEWILEKAKENVGNVAMLRVYDEEGVSEVTLKLTEDLKIVKTNEKPKHVITMPIDVFLLLLSGDMDFGDAYTMGLLNFQGENFHIHALLWAESFKRLRGALKRYKKLI